MVLLVSLLQAGFIFGLSGELDLSLMAGSGLCKPPLFSPACFGATASFYWKSPYPLCLLATLCWVWICRGWGGSCWVIV